MSRYELAIITTSDMDNITYCSNSFQRILDKLEKFRYERSYQGSICYNAKTNEKMFEELKGR